MAVRTLRAAGLAWCLLLAPAMLAGPASAQQDVGARLDEIQEMVLYARYPEAIGAAEGLLQQEGLPARQVNAALEILATAQIANRDEDAASETLRRLYARDPGHRLSDPDASPLVQSAFARARSGAGETVSVELLHESPGALATRESPVIEVRLGENGDAVDEMRVQYRYAGESRFATAVMAVDGGIARARIPLRGGSDAQSIEYYVEALAPSRATLETLASEAEPLSLTVPEESAVAGGGILADSTDDPGTASDEEGSVIGEWWLWTAVGVVVAGGVVAAILIAGSQDGPPDGSLGNVDLGLRF